MPEEELREMVGASLVPATEAVKEAGCCGGRGVGVSDAEIEDDFRCGGIVGGVFVFESVEESFCLCVCEGAAAIFGEGESAFSSSDGSGDGVGDAAQATSEMESPSSKLRSMVPRMALLMTSFSLIRRGFRLW